MECLRHYSLLSFDWFSPHTMHACMYLVILKILFLLNYLFDERFDHTVEFVIIKSLRQDIT